MKFRFQIDYTEEDREAIDHYLNGPKYHLVLSNVAEDLRQRTKYPDERVDFKREEYKELAEMPEDLQARIVNYIINERELVAQAIRERFWELVREEDVGIE